MYKIVRKYARKYPLSTLCIALIWVLSLTPFFPETPLDDVALADKWTHFEKLFFWAWLSPVVMSSVLELLQQYCTGGHRSGDWFDLLANAVGATIGAVIGILLLKFFPKG